MADWIPKRRNPPSSIPSPAQDASLDRDERFLLARVDGSLNVDEIAVLTGIGRTRVESMLQDLMARGAIERDRTSVAPLSQIAGQLVSDDEARHLPELEVVGDEEDFGYEDPTGRIDASSLNLATDEPEIPELGSEHEVADDEALDLDDIPLAVPYHPPIAPAEISTSSLTADDDANVDEPDDDQTQPMTTDDPPLEDETAPATDVDEDNDPELARQAGDLRKLYMTFFHGLNQEQRISATLMETGPRLLCLAFDPEPAIIRSLLANPEASPVHGRLAAFHHRNAQGLEFIAARGDLFRDPQVQRALLKNPQLGENLARRLLQTRRLLDIYKVSLDRDVPDRTRNTARTTLRQKFTQSPPEERFAFIWSTEARVLQQLIGCTLDSRTTKMLTARPVASVMMVQNFARWGATPPALIAHFLKQKLVIRQPPLRKMLLKHPNCPSEAKKNW